MVSIRSWGRVAQQVPAVGAIAIKNLAGEVLGDLFVVCFSGRAGVGLAEGFQNAGAHFACGFAGEGDRYYGFG